LNLIGVEKQTEDFNMTKSELAKTKWAKDFKKDCLSGYADAIEYALIPRLRVMFRKYDGCNFVAIVPKINQNFVLENASTKKQGIALCKEMGWRICK
jgi:hypothetical protein